MYKITMRDTGALLDITNKPRFVAKNEKGLWTKCPQERAEAVAVHSVPYALSDDVPVAWPITDENGDEIGEEAAPIVAICPVSDGALTMDVLRTTNDHAGDIADLNAAVMEISDEHAQTADDLATALMEQADASAGISDDLSAALIEQADLIAQLMERMAALEGKEGE